MGYLAHLSKCIDLPNILFRMLLEQNRVWDLYLPHWRKTHEDHDGLVWNGVFYKKDGMTGSCASAH